MLNFESLKHEACNQATTIYLLEGKIAQFQQAIKAQQSEVDQLTSALARQEHERSGNVDRREESQCQIQIPVERTIPDHEWTIPTREESCDLPEQSVNPSADCD